MDAGDEAVVRAAGGVVWRTGPDDQVEVLLVHRERYDDWTFPKGKLDPGESWEEAAVREVHEESGVVAALGPELGATDYRDSTDRPKRARYWAMTVIEDQGFAPDHEISARAWLSPADAAARLSYARDLPILESFLRSLT